MLTWDWVYESVGVVWYAVIVCVDIGGFELVVVRLSTKKPIAWELLDEAVILAKMV